MKVQKQISLKDFTTAEGFVGRYQHLIKDVVIPYQYKVLCDEMEGVEKSHVIRNFINAGRPSEERMWETASMAWSFRTATRPNGWRLWLMR